MGSPLENHHAPVFMMEDADDARFAPYAEEHSINPDESTADIITRDQIRRCELLLKRPLAEEEKEIIRAHYRETGQIRAPSEHSEAMTIHSPSFLAGTQSPPGSNFASVGGGSSSNSRHRPPRPGSGASGIQADGEMIAEHINELRERINMLEELFDAVFAGGALHRRTSDDGGQGALGRACAADIARLQQQKQAVEQGLVALGKGLKAVREELGELQARTTTTTSDAPGRRRPQFLRGSVLSAAVVMTALMAMVWLVTEAMLHSKRLSDGFGPFINGGYNGLGSVVIFGTWGKFLWFTVVVVYLGMFLVRGALER